VTAPRHRSEQPETTDAAAAQADPDGRCRAFLRDLEVRGASAATRRSYSSDLQQLLEWLAERDVTVADLDRKRVRAFSADLGRRGYAPATLARKLSTLRGLTRHLTEAGVLAADPARSLPGPRRRRRLPRVLSVTDVDTLVAATEGTDPLALRDRLVLELLYGCGLRSMELVALRLGDVQAARPRRAGARRRPRRSGRGRACGDAPRGSASAVAHRPQAAYLGHSPARSKIQPACGYRSGVAAHVAARICDAHAREGCRSSCYPGTVGARLRLDHAGVHARQRGAPAAHL
jgi:integrase